MGKISFGIIGGGWRAEFYVRIAQELPELFDIRGVVVRDEDKRLAFEQKWGITCYRTKEELLRAAPSFLVLSVPWEVNPILVTELAEDGVPVLAETPPAPDLKGLISLNRSVPKGAKVQIAEQYPFQPQNAAMIAVAESGKLGTVTQAQISVAHGYHGICLLRKMLGIQFENATITAQKFTSPIIAGSNRHGPPQEEKITKSNQDIAWLQFEGKLGVFDFTGDQYFSWIRSSRILVRGERGELLNTQIKYLKDFQTPIHMELKRVNAGENGNLEGLYHKGIVLGEQWVYRNPFVPAKLTDDEIAIATCLVKMDQYVKGGESFYSLAEASQDHYLGLMISQAMERKETVVTTTQPWAEA